MNQITTEFGIGDKVYIKGIGDKLKFKITGIKVKIEECGKNGVLCGESYRLKPDIDESLTFGSNQLELVDEGGRG